VVVGSNVGRSVGSLEGVRVGSELGSDVEGIGDGAPEGEADGKDEGESVGSIDGAGEGALDGDGLFTSLAVGAREGFRLPSCTISADGEWLGCCKGERVGLPGVVEGASEGSKLG